MKLIIILYTKWKLLILFDPIFKSESYATDLNFTRYSSTCERNHINNFPIHPEEQRSREVERGELKITYVSSGGKSAKERSDCENELRVLRRTVVVNLRFNGELEIFRITYPSLSLSFFLLFVSLKCDRIFGQRSFPRFGLTRTIRLSVKKR